MNLNVPSLSCVDRIVVMGMSCVGKTTFASLITDREHYCFDALFNWNQVETLGLSTSGSMENARDACVAERHVLDGWHLSDPTGQMMPQGASVFVVYAPYDQIISQYRVPVEDHDQHLPMFRKWYCEIEYSSFQRCHYVFNAGHSFVETSVDEFCQFLDEQTVVLFS